MTPSRIESLGIGSVMLPGTPAPAMKKLVGTSIPMEPIAHAAHHRQRNGSWRDLSVPEDLKRLILATVGKFGGIEAEFEHGRTVRCILYVHLIPDRRKGR